MTAHCVLENGLDLRMRPEQARARERLVPHRVFHMERFHAMYMLSLGRNMGKLEKDVIREYRAMASDKCLNESRCGEGNYHGSVRF